MVVALIVWLALAAVWLLFLVPILRLRRHVDRHAWPAWTAALNGELEEHFSYLRELFEGNAEMVRDMAALAELHRGRGDARTARQRLVDLFSLVETCASRARERLAEWLVICRAALALYPTPPLPPSAFSLRSLRRLAWLHRLVHATVVTSAERFRLRLRALDHGFRLLVRFARRAGARTARRPATDLAAADCRDARDIAHDFGELSRETLDTGGRLLAVVSTTRRSS